MRRALVLIATAALLASGFAACKPKPPKTSDQVEIDRAAIDPSTTEVTPGPEPGTGQDDTADPLAGDLQRVNDHVSRSGLLGDVYFDFDKYDLRGTARERLRKNADFLIQNPEFLVTLEGHCDERGTNEYNLALGERRANAARDYLISLGVGPDRFQRVISYGEEKPVCSQSSEACWSQNRRATFLITARAS